MELIDQYLTPPGRKIDTYQAFVKFRITRLAQIMRRLKKEGKIVRVEYLPMKKGGRYAKYFYA